MINKILIIILIIFNSIFINAYSSDQINFDVPEIEIIDGGNKIIGKKRGTMTINNDVTIEANKFEFDKIKNILIAQGDIKIEDKINNYYFFAQSILYNQNEERIKLKDKVEALVNNQYKFQTEDITIHRNEMTISSDIGAIIIDELNQTRFEIGKFNYSLNDEILKGEKIFINTKYNRPFSDKYFFKSAVFDLKNQNYIAQGININLKKDIFGNKNNDPRFKGISSSSKDGVTTINKGVFTSCKKNDTCPPWTIQADKVTYDKNKKQINYDNALV